MAAEKRKRDFNSDNELSDSVKKSFSVSNRILEIEERLTQKLKLLEFGLPVTHVYNPLEYAVDTHRDFVQKYCQNTKKILFLGMNPGPYGMVQNGVPFGDTKHVINWLNIGGTVNKPFLEHPKRPIQGLQCSRSEVSGSRLWGYLQNLCTKPEKFFNNCYIHNFCPLAFMTSTGKNITPPKLKASEYKPLYMMCDSALAETIMMLEVSVIVGVGKFAVRRAQEVVKSLDSSVEIVSLLHPSPASPQANKGWSEIAQKQLTEAGIIDIIKGI